MNQVPKFQLFNEKYNNEELSNEFHAFFYRYNLTRLFSDAYLSSDISVRYVDAKSVVNDGGSYHKALLEFSELITLGNDNKSYDEAMFKIINESRSFQSMMNKIKELNSYIKTIDERFKFNTWNIVWYKKDLM